MLKPFWLSADNLIFFNQVAVGLTGEPHVIRDYHGVCSIAERPQQLWYYGTQDLFDLAALHIDGCDRRQAFLNGNKRTGFMAATAFIEGNGYRFLAPDQRVQAGVLLEFANGRATRSDVADWLRKQSTPLRRRFTPKIYRKSGIQKTKIGRWSFGPRGSRF